MTAKGPSLPIGAGLPALTCRICGIPETYLCFLSGIAFACSSPNHIVLAFEFRSRSRKGTSDCGTRFKTRRYRSLNVLRSKAMPKFETLPGERSASLISSIINLVCPQCGGSMMEFQCNENAEETGCLNGSGANLPPRLSRADAHRRRRETKIVREVRGKAHSLSRSGVPCPNSIA